MPRSAATADPRIPFPRTDVRLACRTSPHLFDREHGQTAPDDQARIERARTACGRCPIAAGCLKWALANPELTAGGIWAATTARQRTVLRQRLRDRLGPEWVAAVADADRAQARRRKTPVPSPAPAASTMWTSHYTPHTQPLTPAQQEHHRDVLVLAQRTTRTPRSTHSLAEAG